MKFLAIHADFIDYESKKKAISNAEDIPKDKVHEHVDECLVVFTTVEACDEGKESKVASKLKDEILDIVKKVNTSTVVLYPYAHLSSKLAKPDTAINVLNTTKQLLDNVSGPKLNVYKSPFGWYKAFEIKCKGHPLSELSREFCVDDVSDESSSEDITSTSAQSSAKSLENIESEAVKAEEKITKTYYVLTPDGNLVKAEDFDFSNYESLGKLYAYETSGSRISKKEPPHIPLMKKLELVDYEPGSDAGNFRWYPKGVLIKKLLEEHVTNLVIDYGAMEVQTPIMYDYNHPALGKYLHRFPAKQYIVLSDTKKYFLRFAACFGQYLMKHDMQISYKHLPLRLYELTHYSFRREQRGELAGIKRLRTFTMPDMHTLCKDMTMAIDEFKKQYLLSMQFMKALDMDFDCICRFEENFYHENEEFAKDLVKFINKPIIIEMFDKRYAYFVMKFEFSVNDALDKAATLSTVQIDVENAERFDITYTDKDGKAKHPLLLHASISGSIDRDLYALLETQYLKKEQGLTPMLPLWLSPVQVRIIPVSVEKHLDFALDLMNRLNSENIRVDVDDNEDSVSKRILKSNKEWVPYTLVVGDNELNSNVLMVRVRGKKDAVKMSPAELIEEIKAKTSSYPFKPLPLPKLLSKRPIFYSGS